jgi:hypothetical protein
MPEYVLQGCVLGQTPCQPMLSTVRCVPQTANAPCGIAFEQLQGKPDLHMHVPTQLQTWKCTATHACDSTCCNYENNQKHTHTHTKQTKSLCRTLSTPLLYNTLECCTMQGPVSLAPHNRYSPYANVSQRLHTKPRRQSDKTATAL